QRPGRAHPRPAPALSPPVARTTRVRLSASRYHGSTTRGGMIMHDARARLNGFVLVGAVAGLLSATPRGPRAAETLEQVRAQSGKVWYDKYCTPCHGAGGAPGSAVYKATEKPVDLRRYVALHGGKFPAGRWLNVVSVDNPAAVHTETWHRIRDDQQL